ncbi:MAG: hypothetical protein ABFC18_06040 [Rikenellaceae bacterium]
MDKDFLYEFLEFLRDYSLAFTRINMIFIVQKCGSLHSNEQLSIRLIPICRQSKSQDGFSADVDINIFEEEWINKKEIVINRLKANLGLQKTIYARKCVAREISVADAIQFLNANHLLGYTRSNYRYGLFATEDSETVKSESLVAVATFSGPKIINREGTNVKSYEWVRYANYSDFRVVGGMGKLLDFFIQKEFPQEIMSYADRSWGNGNAYVKLGFKLLETTCNITYYLDRKSLERVPKRLLSKIDKTELLVRHKSDFKFIRRF